jgi:hypothetical protein
MAFFHLMAQLFAQPRTPNDDPFIESAFSTVKRAPRISRPLSGCGKSRHILGGRVLQRQALYLSELNGRQEAAWRKTVELFSQDPGQPSQVALFGKKHAPTGFSERV